MLTLESFEEAAEIVKQVTQETKLIKSAYFSELTGNKVFLKPENMQRNGIINLSSRRRSSVIISALPFISRVNGKVFP